MKILKLAPNSFFEDELKKLLVELFEAGDL
jgi:hypothetical protein